MDIKIGDEFKFEWLINNVWICQDLNTYKVENLIWVNCVLKEIQLKGTDNKTIIRNIKAFSEIGEYSGRFVKIKKENKMKFKSIDGNLAITEEGELVELIISTKNGKTVYKTVPVEKGTPEDEIEKPIPKKTPPKEWEELKFPPKEKYPSCDHYRRWPRPWDFYERPYVYWLNG